MPANGQGLAKGRCMIDIRTVTKRFGEGPGAVTALDQVSLEIAENEFFTLLGPSGCGKTTLLRMIAGFEQPSDGQIDLNGAAISDLPPNRRPINTVFQNYALFPHMTVAENVAFGLQMLGKPADETAATVDEMLRLVQLEALRARRPSELSGGQQQRVALARALAPHPQVLLLDEPLSALDLKLRKEMQIELKRLQHETGITFVFVTHDQEEALTMSDRIAVMQGGQVHQVGPPREIYDRPATRFVAQFIGDSNFLAAQMQGPVAELAAGGQLTLGTPQTGAVTCMVRPEHLRLVPPQAPEQVLEGQVENVVYFGTGTHVHLRLRDATTLMVRSPASEPVAIGDTVGVAVPPEAVRILQGA